MNRLTSIGGVGLIGLEGWRRLTYIYVLDTYDLAFFIIKATQLVIAPTQIHIGGRIQQHKYICAPDIFLNPLPPIC